MAAVALTLCVLLSVAGVGVVGDKVYTVVANTSATSCENKTECSLMYYAAHPDQYFREDNTAFFFLPGQHELVNSTLVLMANTTNLSLYGTDVTEVEVVCSGGESGGFSFYNITNLTITNMTFFNCSHWSWKYETLIAVEIMATHNVNINKITINNTAGVGLELTDLSGVTVINHTTIDSSHNTSKSRGGNFVYSCSEASNINHVNISNSFFRYGHNTYGDEGESSSIYINIDFCSASIRIVLDNVHLEGNYGKKGGNILIEVGDRSGMWNTSILIINSWIYNGTANNGGGLCMTAIAIGRGNVSKKHSSTIIKVENTHFVSNTAYYNGGGVYLRLYDHYPAALGRVNFTKTTFYNNNIEDSYPYSELTHGGVAVHIVIYTLPGYDQNKSIFFKVKFTDCLLQHNFLGKSVPDDNASIPRTGALYAEYVESVTLINCNFFENTCSAIVGIHSNFLLHGNNEIRGNRAEKGGGIFFCSSSMMHLHNGTQLNITDNSATLSGGGIYVESECSPQICFYQLDNVTVDNATLQQTQVCLINNTASAGSAIYGGMVDKCILYNNRIGKFVLSDIFDATFHISRKSNDLSVISSDPLYVGFCKINSSTTELNPINCPSSTSVRVKPGKTFSVPAVIMGQRHGLVSGVVVVTQCDHCIKINKPEYSQFINASNKTDRYLNFTVFSKEDQNVTLKLVAEDYYSGFPSYRYQTSYIKITVEKCPLGFIEKNNKCSCLPHIQCDITSQTIHRSSPQWIGYIQECCINSTRAIIIHRFCPLGYCLEKSVHIHATVNEFDQDVQCSEHRTGLLCGECKQNYSLGFGSSQCLASCSTPHRYLQYLRVIGLSAVCAVAGILLVVLLTLLNLTVAEGTLNGLIFYANIVQVNLDLFFPSDTHARPLTAFIAWLNLDFGVTVCFYDGMDAYVKTWLQFIFPLYLWIISGGIVYFSRKSRRVSRLAGNNSVKVLATLILLSFGKLILAVIAAVFFANVKSCDGTVKIIVWRLDANVKYLHGKHITLFVVASITGIVALLYALLLTFIQCLRRAPNSRLCGWILRLKPLLDAYTGPYKNKYHFWTGFLLLVRIALFTSFAANFENNPTLNFTLIIAVCSVLIIGIGKGIYQNKFIGFLESSVYLNLILFSVFTMLSMNSDSTLKTAVVCVFGGWAFLTLVGIVLYHGYKNLFKDSALFGHLQLLFYERLRAGDRNRAAIQPIIIGRGGNDVSQESDSESENEEGLSNQATPHLQESLIGSINN